MGASHWLRKKIPDTFHRCFVKIIFGLGILVVGIELAPMMSYLCVRCATAPQEVWQKIVLALSYFRIIR